MFNVYVERGIIIDTQVKVKLSCQIFNLYACRSELTFSYRSISDVEFIQVSGQFKMNML